MFFVSYSIVVPFCRTVQIMFTKISGIEIAFHYSNGFASVAQIEKGKGETIERNMEFLHPDLEEDFEASGENTYGLLN